MECLVIELNCLGLAVSFHELLCCKFHFLITLLRWLSGDGLLSGPSSVACASFTRKAHRLRVTGVIFYYVSPLLAW